MNFTLEGIKEIMSKDKIIKKIILIFILFLIFITIYIFFKYTTEKKSYAAISEAVLSTLDSDIKISNAPNIDLDEIIKKNTKVSNKHDEISIYEEELEYLTKYRKSNDLYEGTTRVAQEGRNGIQKITIKKTYDENNELIDEKQMSAVVTKASLNKIIEIGTKKKIIIPSANNNLSFQIALNKPSGFTLEQFKKALTDDKDKNKVFENNAQYFYYIEKQYNINGMFVAAVGIHESAWGTSKIATKKYNLFGYGAYDSNPYNGAYNFESYSESIDLLARVFTKYYINPKGTKIYDNQVANGKYYNGNTLEAVNKKYATDKNWANGVYKHMLYLYNKALV